MREFAKGREHIRPTMTRFATYLTLRCLNEQKRSVLAMFSSNKWKSSKFVKSVEGKNIEKIVLDKRVFWQNVSICLKVALPLVKVLCLVDSDECPAMGFIYDAMDKAKEQIQTNFGHVNRQ